MVLLLLVGCVGHGDEPSECATDLALVGFPGVAGETHHFLLAGGEGVELCVQLDTSRNTGDVTLAAALSFSPFPLELRGVNGQPLAAGAGELSWSMPRDQVLHALLAFEVPAQIASTTVQLVLDFAQR